MSEEVTVRLPNQLTKPELLAAGKSPEEADRIMHERVFGVGFKRDEDGNPIEQGKGGPLQQTGQHLEALRIAEERKKAAKPVDIAAIVAAIQGASTTQMTPELIAAAVAAGVKAAMEVQPETL